MIKLYQLGIHMYGWCAKVLSPFNKKAKQWCEGQSMVFDKLPNINDKNIIWLHCASLGEFEQSKPLIKIVKKNFPNYVTFLTFFSPSGYLNTKENDYIDYISYLPLDTPSNAKRFIETIKPSMALFVKNEFWPNYLIQLQKNKIPSFIISGLFRKRQFFFQNYGSWQLSILKGISHFFVQDANSKKHLLANGINQVSVTGDTRFDRLIENVQSFKKLPLIEAFKRDYPLIVCGSTYLNDSQMLIRIGHKNPQLRLIIAPHETDYINELKEEVLLYSQANNNNVKTHSILLIDNIGILSKLYGYADLAYVGGGFGKKGLHNILEPLAFNIPVIYGPNIQGFNEAFETIRLGIGFSIQSEAELEQKIVQLLQQPIEKSIIYQYCKSKLGASKLIFEGLKDRF